MAVSAAAAAAAGVERAVAAAAMAVGGRGTGEDRAGWGLEAEAARGEGPKTVVVGWAESAVSGECGAGDPRCVCARVREETCVCSLNLTFALDVLI